MKNSIFFKITILFLFAMASFFAFSFYFLKDQNEKANDFDRFVATSDMFNKLMPQDDSSREIANIFLKKMGFAEIHNDMIIKAIWESNTLFLVPPNARIFSIPLEFNKEIFLLVVYRDDLFFRTEIAIYQDSWHRIYMNYYLIVLAGTIILVLVFALVMKSLLPIVQLRKQIRRFAKGDLNTTCKIPQNDEIGELANEFDNAIKKIKYFSDSRTLFLRSIMHELKTPITKGRITAEMLEDSTQKTRLISAFTRLNFLIDELAKLEQLASHNYKQSKIEFMLSDLISHIKEMLVVIEVDSIIVKTPNDLIRADFDLFALSIKNLVDNAIKYGTDGKVIIESNGKDLSISNKGEPLKMSLDSYFQPYFKSENSQGFGLGMYIIKNTLEAQNLKIVYEYNNGVNIFTIKDCVIESSCLLPKKENLNART